MFQRDFPVTVVKYSDRKYLMMRYLDPVTGKQVARSTRTTDMRQAERAAARWEAELIAGNHREPANISWKEFRERYEDEKLASLADNTLTSAASAFNHLERLINPQKLGVLTPTVLSQFQAALRREGMRDTTIAAHLRHLRAALSWAVTMDLLREAPRFHMPKRIRGRTLMRGRPLSADEFIKMSAAAGKVRPQDTAIWTHYLEGLWLSGLRLQESLILSWDIDAPFAVDFSGRRPRFRIYAEAEKGNQDRLLPMAPDFAEFLLRTPPSQRVDLVFNLCGRLTRRPMTSARVGRIVSEFGKTAGILVNKADEKFASAHDLRRSFGTRWASRVKPATLQLLMRHASIETTLKYYVAQDADDVADELWSDYEARQAKTHPTMPMA